MTKNRNNCACGDNHRHEKKEHHGHHGHCGKGHCGYDLTENEKICKQFDYSRKYPFDGSKAKYAYKYSLCEDCDSEHSN
jgi:hypothetical protein